MHNYYPILWVGAIIGVISTLLIVAAFVVKDGEKETGFERNMKDSEIMQRLMDYAKPFYRQFIVVGFLMLFSIAYDIISPLIVGKIEELVVGKFALNTLFLWVAGYAAILLVSMACTYFQAVILQKTGQKIISNMREDLFVHIERLSHEQLNEIPVGKLVTRTTNDTNAISLMFTNLLVNLLKNFFVIIGPCCRVPKRRDRPVASPAHLRQRHRRRFRGRIDLCGCGVPSGAVAASCQLSAS